MTDSSVVRFAPSPTGPPHLGNLRTALYDWLLARATGGRFILRIDDTDQARYDPTAEAQMLAALEWLGLGWDEGPVRQSERLERYQQAAEQLVEQGDAYRPASEPEVIRLRTKKSGTVSFEDAVRGTIRYQYKHVPRDPVLLKSDGYPTYHLASVVDDHDLGVTHVLRGEEWIPSTPIHLQLMEALGFRVPTFVHLSLITNSDGTKLSKRDPESQFSSYPEAGYLPEAVINALTLLGWHPGTEDEIFTLAELVERFDVAGINKKAAVLDEARMRWFNRQHLNRLTDAEFAERLAPFLAEDYPQYRDCPEGWKADLAHILRDEIDLLGEAPQLARWAFELVEPDEEAQAALNSEAAEPVLTAFLAAISEIEPFDAQSLATYLKGLRKEFKASHGWGGRAVMFPLRAALIGRVHGPHLDAIAALLGPRETAKRLSQYA